MNEPSNFVDGSEDGCTNNLLDQPPFVPRKSSFFENTRTKNYELLLKMYLEIHSVQKHYVHLLNMHFLPIIICTICTVILKQKRRICKYSIIDYEKMNFYTF
jgi:hypothetical protein